MKKINKFLTVLGCGVAPLMVALPAMTSCGNKKITLDTNNVEKDKFGWVADATQKTGIVLISGFKYTGPNNVDVKVEAKNVSWAGTYAQPQIVSKVDGTFRVEMEFTSEDAIYGDEGTFDLTITIGNKTFDVTGFSVYFQVAKINIEASDLQSQYTLGTKQTDSFINLGTVYFTYDDSQYATGLDGFYIKATVDGSVQSTLEWYVTKTSKYGALDILCFAKNIPDSGEVFNVTLKIGNKLFDSQGIEWGKEVKTTITLSKNDADLFIWQEKSDANGSYIQITDLNTVDESVVIPETINSLPVKSISGLGSRNLFVKSVVLPHNMTHYDGDVLAECDYLESISINGVEEKTKHNGYWIEDNCVLKDQDSKVWLLTATTKAKNIPDSVNVVAGTAFKTRNIEEVNFGTNVSEFNGEQLQIPKKVKNVTIDTPYFTSKFNGNETNMVFSKSNGSSIFDTIYFACDNSVAIPTDPSIKHIYEYCYKGCNITSLTIPNNIQTIGTEAFAECESLRNIVIPSSVTQIVGHLFEGDVSLETVTLPKTLTLIDSYAFWNCWSLKNVIYDGGEWAQSCAIKLQAFDSCFSLQSYKLPANVNSIGERVFDHCNNLKNLTVDPANTKYQSKFDGVESCCIVDINTGATDKYTVVCGTDYSVIPTNSKVVTIADTAFPHLLTTKMTIPANINRVYGRSFFSCENLAHLYVLGEGKWTAWKQYAEVGTGTDVTAAIKDPTTAYKTLQNYHSNGGHITRTAE